MDAVFCCFFSWVVSSVVAVFPKTCPRDISPRCRRDKLTSFCPLLIRPLLFLSSRVSSSLVCDHDVDQGTRGAAFVDAAVNNNKRKIVFDALPQRRRPREETTKLKPRWRKWEQGNDRGRTRTNLWTSGKDINCFRNRASDLTQEGGWVREIQRQLPDREISHEVKFGINFEACETVLKKGWRGRVEGKDAPTSSGHVEGRRF